MWFNFYAPDKKGNPQALGLPHTAFLVKALSESTKSPDSDSENFFRKKAWNCFIFI